jgi:hypothetical protein
MNLKNRKYALSVLIGLFLVLLSTSSFFHNHGPAIEEPVSCPVFLFQTVLSTAVISLILLVLTRIDNSEFFAFNQSTQIPKKLYFPTCANRAPPGDIS